MVVNIVSMHTAKVVVVAVRNAMYGGGLGRFSWLHRSNTTPRQIIHHV
jgi:hypothetical protein